MGQSQDGEQVGKASHSDARFSQRTGRALERATGESRHTEITARLAASPPAFPWLGLTRRDSL
ncbi:MAG: hypothetical protein RL458_3000 [Pseudomonadota bacterium]